MSLLTGRQDALDRGKATGAGLDVSIIIVNWNTRELLRNCLRSIGEQTRRVSFEVIVVDNASEDGSAAMVRSAFPQVTLIENADNRGFAAANNQGISLARGRYVLLLNPDTVVLDEAVDKTVAFADTHPQAGVVGCQVLENDTVVQQTCFSFPSAWNLVLNSFGLSRVFPRSRVFGMPEMGWWNRDTEKDVDVVSGMFMLVRHEAIDQVGLMDEDYFVYAEEADWCYRFQQAGWRCVFAPVARIIHLDGGGKSTSQISARMYVQQQKSLLIFHYKNRGWFSWAAAKMVYILSMLLRTLVWNGARLLGVGQHSRQRAVRAMAALRFHLLGVEPKS